MLTYRRMTVDDVPAVLEVRFATVENAITLEELDADYGITPQTMAASLQADVRGWLCRHGDRAVGFAMADRANGEVQVVAVLPDYEGRGIGRTLLEQACDWLFAEGHDEIWLSANPDPDVRASGFYRRLGWRRSGVMKGDDEVLRLSARPLAD
ncbi:MAG: GNAT family N-acetyltransferase [Kiloniellaceae bacterium]